MKLLFLPLVILMNESCFYLLNPASFQLLSITVVSIVIVTLLNLNTKRKYSFKYSIIFLLIICFIESINSYIKSGQPILTGLQTVKFYYQYLIYFYIIDNFSSKKGYIILEKLLIGTGLIASIIYFIQSILYNKIVFLNMSFLDPRFGNTRFYLGFTPIIFSFFLCLSKNSNKHIVSNYMLSIAGFELFVIIWVTQTRNFILGILITTIFIFFLQNKCKSLGVLALIIFSIPIIMIIGGNSIIGSTVSFISSPFNEMKNMSGTSGFRLNEINFFMNSVRNNPILGLGFYSDHFQQSFYITGLYLNYYLSDIGVIGFLFQTGMIGIIWLVTFIIQIISLIRKLYKIDKNNSLFFIAVLLYTLTTIFSSFYYGLANSILYIVIMISMLEIKYRNLSFNKN